MKLVLRDIFKKHYFDILTPNSINSFINFVKEWELKKDHPLVLNSPYIGIDKILFVPKDKDDIFSIFQVDENDIDYYIRNSEGYISSHETANDPLNVFLLWVIHLGLTNYPSRISKKRMKEFNICVLVMLYYKFFTSRVNRMFRYGANENIMRYTIESLNYKFDIVRYESWKEMFYAKAEEIIYDPNNIHYKTLRTFVPNKAVRYVISNIKTKVNSSIDSIRNKYYDYYSQSKSIPDYDAIVEIDNTKIINDQNYIYDILVYSVINQLNNRSVFIDDKYINSLSSISSSVNVATLKRFLLYIFELAKEQKDKNQIENKKEYTFYSGVHILITKIIEVSFKELIKRESLGKNRLLIFSEIRKMYSGSRISSPSVVNVKRSVQQHVLNSGITKRSITISGLTISFILYIFLKVFETMK